MKNIALHLLLITSSVTSFHEGFTASTSPFSGPQSSLLASATIRLPTNLKSSNDNQQEHRYYQGYGSSYLDHLESARNPNPAFPSTKVPGSNGISPSTPSHQPGSAIPVSPTSPSSTNGWNRSRQPDALNAPAAYTQDTASTSTSEFKVVKGLIRIQTEEEYRKLISAYPDKLIVVKFFASFCRSCKALAPRMAMVMKDKQLQGLPIVWAEFETLQSNKDVFRRLGVITLPTIHFYDGDHGLVENFPCPPSKVPLLKKKLARFLNARVDPTTRQISQPEEQAEESLEPRRERTIVNNEMITGEHLDFLRNDLPFFKDLTDVEFDTMIQKARLLTFNPGDVIMKQGMPGRTFYVIKSGSVEMSIKSKFDDPISTPPNYLGAVVNTLRTFDYFGERSLTTGEPFAASFRSLDKARCFAFHVDIIPPSSILSRKREATQQTIDLLNQRYVLPEDYKAPNFYTTKRDKGILELLVRFKQIRQAARCLDYMMQTGVKWGDAGAIGRRTQLVRTLTYSQQNEFNDVFNMVDVGRRGRISLQQIHEFMASAKESEKDGEFANTMKQVSDTMDSEIIIARDEFMGIMAEAEFYNLFKETFQELDHANTGFVRAGDLDQILGGVRDLIGDKRHTSIIDVDDKDMLVDYEQFSKMLLGAAI